MTLQLPAIKARSQRVKTQAPRQEAGWQHSAQAGPGQGVQNASPKSWFPPKGPQAHGEKQPGNDQIGQGHLLIQIHSNLECSSSTKLPRLAWSCTDTSARISLCQPWYQAGRMLDHNGTPLWSDMGGPKNQGLSMI